MATAIYILQKISIASFLKGHTVLLALTVSIVWLLAGYDFFRKGNAVGAFLWGGIAMVILFSFSVHELLFWDGSWVKFLLPVAGIAAEAAVIKRWLRQAKR